MGARAMPRGAVGAGGVGCNGGRDMKLGSLGCGGVTAAGDGCGADGAVGIEGMPIEGKVPAEAAGTAVRAAKIPLALVGDSIGSSGAAEIMWPRGAGEGVGGASGLRRLNTVTPSA